MDILKRSNFRTGKKEKRSEISASLHRALLRAANGSSPSEVVQGGNGSDVTIHDQMAYGALQKMRAVNAAYKNITCPEVNNVTFSNAPPFKHMADLPECYNKVRSCLFNKSSKA